MAHTLAGPALNTGYTVHVGTDAHYLALYCPADLQKTPSDPDGFLGGLTHIGVCVRDLVACESRAKKAGFTPRDHAEYEPGSRFYFHDFDGIEYEVVSYSFE